MATLKTWIKAARPRTVLLSFSSILTGAFLATSHGHCNYWAIPSALITALLLQVLSNLANDYGDFKKGVDGPDRQGPRREMQSGHITEKEMKTGLFVTATACLLSGAALIFLVARLTWKELGFFALLGIGAVMAALLYTLGRRPYGYRGLGDLFCFLFFGIAATAGTYYLATKDFDWTTFMPASTMGFMSNAVLNINNMRDYDTDKASGKTSFVVKIGLRNAFIYHAALVLSGFLCLSIYLLLKHAPYYTHLFWLLFPVFFRDLITIKKGLDKHRFDPLLPKQVGNTFLLTVVFGALLLL